MRRIKIWLLLLAKYTQRYNKILIISGIFLIVVLLLFAFMRPKLVKNQISEGIVGTHTESDLPPAVLHLLSQGLTTLEKSGEVKPNLAENWEVSEDVKVYKFKLRDNLNWIDGTKLVAADINILIPGAEIKAIDDKTLEFKLNDSFSPLPSLLTKPVIKRDSLIGIGPFFITKIEKHPNQVFIKKLTLKSTNTALPEVIIRFYPNEKIAKNALKVGEVQSILGVNELDEFKDQKPFASISKTNFQRIVAIFFNNKDSILSDRNFRQALSFASPSIKDEVEAKTSISPNSWAYNLDVKDYLDNPEEAKESLEKVKNGRDTTITLTAVGPLSNVGEKIVEEWNKQGIKSVLRIENGIPQNFQALLISQNIPVDPDQYSLWHSTQVQTNISRYSSPNQYSPRVDRDLEDGRKTLDQNLRKQRYADFQKYLLDDAPATFLYFPKFNVVYMKKIEVNLQKVLTLQFPEFQE